MKSPLKNLKKYFQLIMTALICFVMGVIEDKKRICIKDTDSKKDRTVLRPDDKKNNRKNKIIYWNEPRIQNRINSIKDTQKITNAMYMISSSKLK